MSDASIGKDPRSENSRYFETLRAAVIQGFDSGVRSVVGTPYKNNFEKTQAPRIVWESTFQVGRSLTLRRFQAIPVPDPGSTVDELRRQISELQTALQLLTR